MVNKFDAFKEKHRSKLEAVFTGLLLITVFLSGLYLNTSQHYDKCIQQCNDFIDENCDLNVFSDFNNFSEYIDTITEGVLNESDGFNEGQGI